MRVVKLLPIEFCLSKSRNSAFKGVRVNYLQGQSALKVQVPPQNPLLVRLAGLNLKLYKQVITNKEQETNF